MPFLAPLAGPLIGLGSSLIGGLLNKKGSSSSSSSSALLPPGLDSSAIVSGLNKQTGVADWMTEAGKNAFNRGNTLLDKPIDYNSAILGGDRTAIMESLAPEVAAVNAQFQAPLAQAMITGRNTALQPDVEASRQAAISSMMFGARPAASDKLTNIAQGLMNLGTQQTGGGASIYGRTTGDILDYNKIIQGMRFQASRDRAADMGRLGTSIGGLISQILLNRKGAEGPAAPKAPPIVLPPWEDNVPLPGPGGF